MELPVKDDKTQGNNRNYGLTNEAKAELRAVSREAPSCLNAVTLTQGLRAVEMAGSGPIGAERRACGGRTSRACGLSELEGASILPWLDVNRRCTESTSWSISTSRPLELHGCMVSRKLGQLD